MTAGGSPAEWLNLIDSLVPNILELVLSSWTRMPAISNDTNEDQISETLCKCLQKNPDRASLPFQIRPQIIELDPVAGQDQGRMDIVFLLLVTREDIYFTLECKRLNVTKGANFRPYTSEYIQHGMMRFIRGQYAAMVRHGAMVGFVFNGNINQAIQNVEDLIKVNYKELGMNPPGNMMASSICPSDSRVRETNHIRQHNGDPFQIHHMFVSTI